MKVNRFYIGEPYFDKCPSCNTKTVHHYVGFQEGFREITRFHIGNCGNCHTSRSINLEKRTEPTSKKHTLRFQTDS